jgi:hypothetical protein
MKMKSVFLRSIGFALPLVAAITVVNPAMAGGDPPFLSSPSGGLAGDSLALSGSNFPPSAIVKVSVTEPLGQQYVGYQTVDANGRLSYILTSSLSGMYQVRVLDQSGNALASAAVMFGGNR